MGIKDKAIDTAKEYTRLYDGLFGADFREVPEDVQKHFGYLENMYVDYESDSVCVESIPGFRQLLALGYTINGIFPQKLDNGNEYILIHAGTYLYRLPASLIDHAPSELRPILGSLKNNKSRALLYNGYTLILDGNRIFAINQNGDVRTIEQLAYVPSLTVDGKDRDDVNMLTDDCVCTQRIKNYDRVCFASEGIEYEVTNVFDNFCKVVGIDENFVGALHIPSYAEIGGKRYKVTEIGASAFKDHTGIELLYTNSAMKKIGRYAFWNCTNLRVVNLANTVTEIDAYAFSGCTALSTVYVSVNMTKVGAGAFDGCKKNMLVCYEGSTDLFSAISGYDYISPFSIKYNHFSQTFTIGISINARVASIDRVLLNGSEHNHTFIPERNMIMMTIQDALDVYESDVEIYAHISTEGYLGDYFSRSESETVSALNAIKGCTLGFVHNGRIFLSGNPNLPGFVFFSSEVKDAEETPFYFSSHDYFVDGGEGYHVSAILDGPNGIIVCKNGDTGTGTIFYHKEASSDGRKVFPTYYVHRDLPVLNAYTFCGEPLFLTEYGIFTLKMEKSGYYRPYMRSECINPKLFLEDMENIQLGEWLGYLVVFAGENIYLADPRQRGGKEYDWYFISKIGTLQSYKTVYRFCSDPSKKIYVDDESGVNTTVYSNKLESGDMRYYVKIDNVEYEVYPTEERSGGKRYPAITFTVLNNLLIFGTKDNIICVFNNDKRGVAPDSVKSSSDFKASEYKKAFGNRIHPEFYSFAGAAPHYEVSTAFDDCGLYDRAKSTIRSSLFLKLKSFRDSLIKCSVRTDKTICPDITFWGGKSDFGELNLGKLTVTPSTYTTVCLSEGERGWREKQISIYTDEFASPIGIYSMLYRYKIKGKYKE